jgi:Cohesin domain
MEPEELSSHGTSRVLVLSVVSLVVITVAIIGIVIFARNRVKEARDLSRSNTLQEEVKKQEETVTGRIGLSIKGTALRFSAGQTVTLFVYADSQKQEIMGYDAVLRYDTKQLRFENVKSIFEGISIYETEDSVAENTSELILTGIPSSSSQGPFVFHNTALAEVTFTVLDSSPITIDVAYEPGSSRESNLMTPQNQDIVSSVLGVTLNEK